MFKAVGINELPHLLNVTLWLGDDFEGFIESISCMAVGIIDMFKIDGRVSLGNMNQETNHSAQRTALCKI